MATVKVDESTQEFINTVMNGSEEELNDLKTFLFRENIRLEMEKRELEEKRKQVIEDRQRLHQESDEVNNQIVRERKRLKEEQIFFDKKVDILKNGFEALEADRKALEKARKQFEYEKNGYSKSSKRLQNEEFAIMFFKGVNSLLGLKKRYKDLLKIFHPDNMGGDHEMVMIINSIYEDLKKNYDNFKII